LREIEGMTTVGIGGTRSAVTSVSITETAPTECGIATGRAIETVIDGAAEMRAEEMIAGMTEEGTSGATIAEASAIALHLRPHATRAR
jgi:hypothetical protein